MIQRILTALVLASFLSGVPLLAQQNVETKVQRDQRMHWWREARFGMFIHWGIYAVPAGEYNGERSDKTGEWIMDWANIPRSDYEKFAKQFNPVKFDAKKWVRIAKDAGMKYIVITSKHHDGFAMYGSKVSAYDVVDATPYRRDPIKELAAEAKKQGQNFAFIIRFSIGITPRSSKRAARMSI